MLLYIGSRNVSRDNRERKKESEMKHGLRARIEDFPLSDIVQLLCSSGRYGRLTVRQGEKVGAIYFAEGAVIHARYCSKTGLTAFRIMFNWGDGEFVLEFGIFPETRTIEEPLHSLLNGDISAILR
ncbi:MAG: DUF4388 domain-containing protein [Candidatus Coatesbacteria bacterium]|nr:MAG: DUF4388 domain-containing protein [Candidatus Coatesbacteria bacterium]